MKFLIAGLGSIGRRHLRNLVALGEQDVLLYRTYQSTLPDDQMAPFEVETDLDAALAHKPDAVIVANPTALHLQVAIPAAQAGCHLLLEKPIADQFDARVDDLRRAAGEAGIQTLVGFQLRFHPVLLRIKQLLDSGKLGAPYSVRAHWGEYLPGWHSWEDYRKGYAARKDLGGGVVNTLSHPLDYVRWLLGEVKLVSAITGHVSNLELDVEDTAEISLGFENGCIGSIHLDYHQRPPAHWMAVNCEKGQIRWDSSTGAANIYWVEGDRWEIIEPPAGFDRNDLFMEEMRHFIAVIKGETDSRCSLADGIRALELTEAVHTSARRKCSLQI